MSTTEEVLTHIDQGVLWITLNRPEKLNALTPDMISGLRQVLEAASLDEAVRAVVLRGAGRGFCAGGDVKAMTKRKAGQTLESRTQHLRYGMESALLLHDMPKPTIAMIRGPIAGAGLSLALACDIAIASDTVDMTPAFVKVGLSGDFGGSYFLHQRLGHKAREFLLLSPRVKADQALTLGLVNQVVADSDLESHTGTIAGKLAAGPGITLGHIKANLNAMEQGATLPELLDMEALRHSRCGMTEDHAEAAAAFVEKRTPIFHNR